VWLTPAAGAAAAIAATAWTWAHLTAGAAPGQVGQVTQFRPPGLHRAATLYTVQRGDSLSGVAQRFYGTTRWWPGLWQANRDVIGADPEVLRNGIVLEVPARPDTRAKTPRLGHRHAVYQPQHAAGDAVAAVYRPAAAVIYRRGMFSYAALENIWMAVGGRPYVAPHAACIAERESGGDPGAVSATNDYGLWQIHNDPGALSPAASARAAVRMSGNGRNWSAWTTAGMC
jgi:hypothetical protein